VQVGRQGRPFAVGLAQHQHAVVDTQGHVLDAAVRRRVTSEFHAVQHDTDEGDQGAGVRTSR